MASLNADQRRVHDSILASIDAESNNGEPRMFFLLGPAGSGKTFTINTIILAVQSRGEKVIVCSSSGISSLLLNGGRTAHSVIKIPIENPHDRMMCSLSLDSDMALQIRNSALTVWDECFMQDRYCFESVDRLYRDICHRDIPFGGKVVMFSGDPRQILPVIPRGTESAIVSACFDFVILMATDPDTATIYKHAGATPS